jgi:NADPH:quinone reductase-like Zn-dependent oxidoreductase
MKNNLLDFYRSVSQTRRCWRLARLADGGELRARIDAVFPLQEARSAFERSLGGKRRGKIVLSVVEER